MKQFNCSARVCLSHAAKKVFSDSSGDASSSEDEEDEDGVQRGDSARVVGAAVPAARPCYPLFIDGIADSVDYSQVRDLFLQHGRLTNVFLQRKRRSGRKFRFGFVRYAKKEDAVKAMEFLDGVRLGGAYLSVKPEIYAGKMRGGYRRRCSVSVDSLAPAKISHAQGRPVSGSHHLPSRRSWSAVVKGVPVERPAQRMMLDSEVMFPESGGGCGPCLQRISDDFLFPESVSTGRCEEGGVVRACDEVLFPEMGAWVGLEVAPPLAAAVVGDVVEGALQLVGNEEVDWKWDQFFTPVPNYDSLMGVNSVVYPMLELRGCLVSFKMGFSNFNLSLISPLGTRRSLWPWLNDFVLNQLGFLSVAFKVCTTPVSAAGGFLDAREVVGDSDSSAYDVGSLSCDEPAIFRPSHSCFEVGACSVIGSDLVRGAQDCSEAFSEFVREEDAFEEEDAATLGDDLALDFSSPRPRPSGRPKKFKEAKINVRGLGGLGVVRVNLRA